MVCPPKGQFRGWIVGVSNVITNAISFLGIGNNSMVGCTIACAIDVATALGVRCLVKVIVVFEEKSYEIWFVNHIEVNMKKIISFLSVVLLGMTVSAQE
jgi:hypothetical protein